LLGQVKLDLFMLCQVISGYVKLGQVYSGYFRFSAYEILVQVNSVKFSLRQVWPDFVRLGQVRLF